MFTLNEALKIAGMPVAEERGGMNQVGAAIKALLDEKVLEDGNGLEWIDYDEDDEPVKGPDGKMGWFNDGTYAHAVDKLDPAAVRIAAQFIWFLERLKNGAESSDYALAAKIAEEHFTK